MDRRNALKILGIAVTSPSLLLAERKIITRRSTGKRIPLGFPALDKALQGGIKPGEICAIYGTTLASTFLRSVAINMGQSASVALVTQSVNTDAKDFKPYRGTVSVHTSMLSKQSGLWRRNAAGIGQFEQLNRISAQHNAILLDGIRLLRTQKIISDQGVSHIPTLAIRNECAFLYSQPTLIPDDSQDNLRLFTARLGDLADCMIWVGRHARFLVYPDRLFAAVITTRSNVSDRGKITSNSWEFRRMVTEPLILKHGRFQAVSCERQADWLLHAEAESARQATR